MRLVFVDANILIYSEDKSDAGKQAIALRWLDALWANRMGRVSTQTLNEFYINATRKLRPPLPGGDARAEVRRYGLWQPWQIDHKRKTDRNKRDANGMGQGVVAWDVEVTNQHGETVASYDILTLVAKRGQGLSNDPVPTAPARPEPVEGP